MDGKVLCVVVGFGDPIWKRSGGLQGGGKRWHDDRDLKGGSQQADPSSEARPKICGGGPGQMLGVWGERNETGEEEAEKSSRNRNRNKTSASEKKTRTQRGNRLGWWVYHGARQRGKSGRDWETHASHSYLSCGTGRVDRAGLEHTFCVQAACVPNFPHHRVPLCGLLLANGRRATGKSKRTSRRRRLLHV